MDLPFVEHEPSEPLECTGNRSSQESTISSNGTNSSPSPAHSKLAAATIATHPVGLRLKTPKGSVRKNSQNACLECRKRHKRCDGITPVCGKCRQTGRTCTFVASNRGGARISERNIKSRITKLAKGNAPVQEQLAVFMGVDTLSNWAKPGSRDPTTLVFDAEPLNASEGDSPRKAAVSPEPQPTQPLSRILDIYYEQFHHSHPFLPPRKHLETYVGIASELLAVLSLTTDILSSTHLIERETIERRVMDAKQKISSAIPDLIKLQASVLLGIISYMCAMPLVSQEMNTMTSELCFSTFKEDDQTCREILKSSRTSQIEPTVFLHSLATTVHEAYFSGVIFRIISGQPFSPFIREQRLVHLLPVQDEPHFAYKTRFRTVQVVQGLVVNITSCKHRTQDTDFQRLEKLISWLEQMLYDAMTDTESGDCTPDAIPKLVNSSGVVNDGIHQSIMTIYYSIILLHYPISCLGTGSVAAPWVISKPTFEATIPMLPPLLEGNVVQDPFGQGRASTLKTLRAAKLLTSLLSRIDLAATAQRSPFFSCFLVPSGAIRLRAVSLLKSLPERADYEEDELKVATKDVKLSLQALELFGQKWRRAKELGLLFAGAACNEPEFARHLPSNMDE